MSIPPSTPESPLWYKRETCRLCGSEKLDEVVELAPIPVATPNFRIPGADHNHPAYREAVPMPLHLCRDCTLLQIVYIGDPELQYREYAYTTSLSLGLPQHFVNAADHLVDRLELPKGGHIVEFGSNDGTYLRAFQAAGMRVTGIDPAQAIAEQATAGGIITYPEFFDSDLAQRIRDREGEADLLVANNVIANIDNLAGLFDAVRILLADDGAFVFETQYGLDVTENLLLDTIYHEHLSYMNVTPFERTLPRFGLSLFDIEHVPIKGGSVRVYVQTEDGGRPVAESVAGHVAREERLGCDRKSYFNGFTHRIGDVRTAVHKHVDDARQAGSGVAGYGVSVGTTTLLEQLDLTERIDFLVDDDPNKESTLVGPGYEIPVYRSDQLLVERPALTVVFAWRYIDAIAKGNAEYCATGGKFLVPLPSPMIKDI